MKTLWRSESGRMFPLVAGTVYLRCTVRGLLGSLSTAWVLESGPFSIMMLCVAVAGLGLAGVRVPLAAAVIAWLALGFWILCVVGQSVYFDACRRRSREAGLAVLVVVPEDPRLLCRLCRRVGLCVHWRPHALAVHVDDRWRPPPGLSPKEAAEEFGRQYRADYDRLLAELAGQAVVVISSTYNRHDSAWTRRAADEGWCRVVPGPLFRAAPARHGPRTRAAEQRRMFGGVVSDRRVDRREAWRTRVFDCMRYRLQQTRVTDSQLGRAPELVFLRGDHG